MVLYQTLEVFGQSKTCYQDKTVGVTEAACSHSEIFAIDFGEVRQMDQCQCKSSEQNMANKHQSCGSGLGGHCTNLMGRQAGGEAEGLEEALTVA